MATNNTLLGKRPQGDYRKKSPIRFWALIALTVVILLAIIGLLIRWHAHSTLRQRTEAESIPTVTVVKPKSGAGSDEINLPGTVEAFIDAPIYARTSGYLKAWYVDIGGKVKAGQLLALIESPEVDQQLEQARADLGTAKANYELAAVTNKRYQVLVKTNAVSRQEADQTASQEAAQKANVDAAAANVKRLEALQSFEKVYAPFDGIVTARNTDVGQLITSGTGGGGGTGTGTGGQQLFRVASAGKLRTFIPVPQTEAPYIVTGMPADLSFIEYPDKKFPGKVARTSSSIDITSRTLLTEVDIDNSSGALFPGAYVDVHLDLRGKHDTGAFRVLANTLIFRSHGMQIAIVGADNKVHLQPVTVGRDFGTEVELVSGVKSDDNIVLNPPDSLADGQDVKIAPPPTKGTEASQDGQSSQKDKNGDQKNSSSNDDKKKSGDKPPEDIKPSPGSGGATEKQSRAPDTDNKGGDSASGGSSGGGQSPSKTGSITESGQTAPGTDGNAAK